MWFINNSAKLLFFFIKGNNSYKFVTRMLFSLFFQEVDFNNSEFYRTFCGTDTVELSSNTTCQFFCVPNFLLVGSRTIHPYCNVVCTFLFFYRQVNVS